MIKTIKLREGLELTMTNDSLWMEEYRDQFGQDILPVIMPLILSLSSSISGHSAGNNAAYFELE